MDQGWISLMATDAAGLGVRPGPRPTEAGPLPGRLLPDPIDRAEHGTHVSDPDLVVSPPDFHEATTRADIGQRGLILSFDRSHPVAELGPRTMPGGSATVRQRC